MTVSGDDPTLLLELAPSIFSFDYYIFLQDGWSLYEVAPDGSERLVSGTLLNNFQSFTIKAQRTTPIFFQFKVGSFVVTIGNGILSVNIRIDDTPSMTSRTATGCCWRAADGAGRGSASTTAREPRPRRPGRRSSPRWSTRARPTCCTRPGDNFAVQGPLPSGAFAFGAGVGVNLPANPVTGMPGPYDASGYDGIGFDFRYAFPSNQVPLQDPWLLRRHQRHHARRRRRDLRRQLLRRLLVRRRGPVQPAVLLGLLPLG